MIKLTEVCTYKDGGSIGFRGSDGKEYWQCFRIGAPKDMKGKLYAGSINDRPRKLAKGDFLIIEKITSQIGRKLTQ